MVGTRWFKCDLHLHTPASKCFKDTTVTPEQWIEEAERKGLNCVAVTDHNTAEWIDRIKEVAAIKKIFVFPGVEITCSDSKVHLLVLFDMHITTQEVEDFITLTGIERRKFGEQDAHSSLSVEEVMELAIKKGALCIPAHIDEYNGLCQVANTLRDQIFNKNLFLGVQVVHEELLVDNNSYNKTYALEKINKYYNKEAVSPAQYTIKEDRLKDWRSVVVQAIKYGKAILTFSDNPHAEKDSKHGLWGIGRRYSWIKMDKTPSLESLRHALLLPKFRIKNDFVCKGKPYTKPDVWFNKIVIMGTEISRSNSTPLTIEFGPQMNTIIGGRGSGKSSILHFIRGVFSKENELASLPTVINEFKNFFKLKDSSNQGVLKNNCKIEIYITRKGEEYILRMQQLQNSKDVKILKINAQGFEEELQEDTISFFNFDIFSQKQIYEIATNLNSLRDRIDDSNSEIAILKKDLGLIERQYLEKSAELRTLKLLVENKGIVNAQIVDISGRIDRYKASGIETELHNIDVYQKDSKVLNGLVIHIEEKSEVFTELEKAVSVEINIDDISEDHKAKLSKMIEAANEKVAKVKSSLQKLKSEYLQISKEFNSEIQDSDWKIEFLNCEKEFERKKQELSESGAFEIEQVEDDISQLRNMQDELFTISETEQVIVKKQEEKQSLRQQYIDKRISITERRKKFLNELLKDVNVRAKVEMCRDIDNLEDQLRQNINIDYGVFDADIDTLVKTWSITGESVESNNDKIVTAIQNVFNGTSTQFYAKFNSRILGLSSEQIDCFGILFPEDKIKLEYKTSSNQWKELSNASAGQKTAAILTLILCQGTTPLILDQPEDDLDNNLIYDLVVEQLRKTKECRQIICVTHNANIPVNGDSEHIIVMDSETKHIEAKQAGCIEDNSIKKSICNIMEGGPEAFEMRSMRYKVSDR